MNHAISHAASAARPSLPLSRRVKRQAAALAARCAMGSWVVLAAMPVAVVVCALA